VIGDPHARADEKRTALADFSSYCREVVAEKRRSPVADVLSDLVRKDELTEDEIVGLALQLFQAGHETTASMLALGVFTLLSERDRWNGLCSDSSQLGNAVDELLRYLSIFQVGSLSRTAREDVELGGVLVKQGESVVVSLAVANRDPEKFGDPDALALSRDAVGHLAFGHGRHMCIGQHLARLELKIGLRGLVDRFPNLNLAVPANEILFYGGEHPLYGVEALPVAW
jgi:cytochrome P450